MLGRRHQRRFPVLLHELVDDLLRTLPLPREPQDVLVQRRTVRAGEVGRATRVDVQAAATGAAELFFDRLNTGIGVEGRDRLSRAAGPLRVIDPSYRLTVGLWDGLTE